jgi:hypothetical protein
MDASTTLDPGQLGRLPTATRYTSVLLVLAFIILSVYDGSRIIAPRSVSFSSWRQTRSTA